MAQGNATITDKAPIYFLSEETLELYYDIYQDI